MPFTPVIPSSYQTNRVDLMEALAAIVDAFIVSQSYAIGRQFQSALPASLSEEGPLIVIGDVQESITHAEGQGSQGSGLRTTVFSGDLFYVDWVTDRAEAADRVDVWADHMRDLFTVNARTLPNGVLEQRGLQEGELNQGSLVFTAPSIQFTYTVLEGAIG